MLLTSVKSFFGYVAKRHARKVQCIAHILNCAVRLSLARFDKVAAGRWAEHKCMVFQNC